MTAFPARAASTRGRILAAQLLTVLSEVLISGPVGDRSEAEVAGTTPLWLRGRGVPQRTELPVAPASEYPLLRRARCIGVNPARPLEVLLTGDWLVAGNVAVSRRDPRRGKGEDYAGLNCWTLRAIGHPRMPVATKILPPKVAAHRLREPTHL